MTDDGPNIRTRVSRNTAVLTVAQLADKFVNLALTILLVRYLPEEVFGQYGFVASFVVLFGVLASLGFAPLCTRQIARHFDGANRILSAAVVPMLGTSVFTVAIIGAAVAWTKDDRLLVVAALLAALDLVFRSFAEVFATVPQAHERMEYTVFPQLIRSALVLVLCWMLLPSGLGLVGIMSIIAVAGGTRLLLQMRISWAVFRAFPTPPFDAALSRSMFLQALPLAATSIFVIIYYKIDAVMISYMMGDRDVALYTAATTLAFAPLFVALGFHQATFPTLSKLHTESRDRFARAYRAAMKYLLIIGLPIAGGLFVLAPRAIAIIYGERYLGASTALRMLTLALFLMFLNGFMGNTLIVVNDQSRLMRIVAAGAVLNVGLNLAVIPRYGLPGAAAATVAAELLANVASAAALWRRHHAPISFGDFPGPIACCALMLAFVVTMRDAPLLLLIPAAAIIYAAALFASRTLKKQDLEVLGVGSRLRGLP